jgi:hypothetical protein
MPTKILIENKTTEKQPLPESVDLASAPRLQRQSLVAHLPRGGLNLRALTKNAVLQLQSLIGNRAVGRLMAKRAEQPLQRDVPKPEDKPAKPEDKPAKPESETGLPDNLKSGIENLSGFALDDVRVHYNSPQPARLNAVAYARGTDIYVAPGQERHLPHEAWHVVQQRQGRVRAIAQVGGEPLNDNARLEQEADEMGERALKAPARVAEAERDRSEVAEGDSREDVVQLAKALQLTDTGQMPQQASFGITSDPRNAGAGGSALSGPVIQRITENKAGGSNIGMDYWGHRRLVADGDEVHTDSISSCVGLFIYNRDHDVILAHFGPKGQTDAEADVRQGVEAIKAKLAELGESNWRGYVFSGRANHQISEARIRIILEELVRYEVERTGPYSGVKLTLTNGEVTIGWDDPVDDPLIKENKPATKHKRKKSYS